MFVHDPNADSSSSYGSGPASLPPDVFGSSASKWCGPTETAWRRTEGPPITVTALDMPYPPDWCMAGKFLTFAPALYWCPLSLLWASLHTIFLGLKIELNSNLSDSWWRCLQHASERRVIDVSVDRAVRVELCVVERVESFKPEFERLGFCEFCVLMESDVEIVNARPITEAALGVSLRPQSIRGEQ